LFFSTFLKFLFKNNFLGQVNVDPSPQTTTQSQGKQSTKAIVEFEDQNEEEEEDTTGFTKQVRDP